MGRLTHYDDYYVFQPLEIYDENASLLDRMRPVDYRRPGIEIEPVPFTMPSSDVVETEPAKPLQQTSKDQESQETQEEKVDQPSSSLLEKAIEKIKERNNSLWSQSLTQIYPLLPKLSIEKTEEDKEFFNIFHTINQLTLDEKLSLAYAIYQNDNIPNPIISQQPWFAYVQKFFEERKIQETTTQVRHYALVLPDIVQDKPVNRLWSLTLVPPTLPSQTTSPPQRQGWYSISESLKNQLFKRGYESVFKIPSSKIHYKYGFLNYFSKSRTKLTDEVAFKIKNLNQTNRNNTGARIDQAGVKIIKDHLTELLRPTVVDFSSPEFSRLNKTAWCVLLETVLWFFDLKKKEAYFPLEWTIENHLESLFCSVDGEGNVFDCSA
jgi:hypothetical protein